MNPTDRLAHRASVVTRLLEASAPEGVVTAAERDVVLEALDDVRDAFAELNIDSLADVGTTDEATPPSQRTKQGGASSSVMPAGAGEGPNTAAPPRRDESSVPSEPRDRPGAGEGGPDLSPSREGEAVDLLDVLATRLVCEGYRYDAAAQRVNEAWVKFGNSLDDDGLLHAARKNLGTVAEHRANEARPKKKAGRPPSSDLSSAHVETLRLAAREVTITATDVANTFCLSRQGGSQRVKRLTDLGLLCPENEGSKSYVVTDLGRETLREAAA